MTIPNGNKKGPALYEKLIPVSSPSLGKDELGEIGKVFDSKWLGLGKWVLEFENEIKRFLGAKNAVGTSSGTTALHLALDSIGIKKGDKVIVPSLTFAASVQSIMTTGATPVFCDVEPDTLNMDVDDLARRITKKVRAIMPVHYSGLACDMDAIMEIAGKNRVRVVEDAAHAFGSSYKGRRIGSFGDVTCFSFDPIKNITCGEGGAITTNDDKLVRTIYKKRILGIDKDTWSRYAHKRDWFYNVTELGFRYHMSNINAAIGLVQIKKFDDFMRKKRAIVERYDEEFSGIGGIELLRRDYEDTAPFNYIIKVKSAKRDGLMKFLKARGIDSGVHYIPNHIQPFFKDFRKRLPVTEKVWKEILTLPLYYGMSDSDMDKIIDSVKTFFK
ncbi:MAG: DegT/DnrJ/EryC1/StrS family aminotransferase [Candidatus Omnitrophica bacterium]|nr:DegT/DnrJ/EryC1/StrS family aminotransferase [Candidatus Omnitrophota bacterium]